MSVHAQSPSPDREITVQRLLQEGRTYYAVGRYALAYGRYAAVLTLDPGNALALDGEKQSLAARIGADERKRALKEKLYGDLSYPVETWYGYADGRMASQPGKHWPDPKPKAARTNGSPLRKTWLYRAAEAGVRMPRVP